jgi:oligosaccharide repeat unit polymerase
VKRFAALNRSLLSPLLAFCIAWTFAALLTQYRLLNGEYGWSTMMIAVVVAVPVAFVAGGLIGEGVGLSLTRVDLRRHDRPRSNLLFRRLLTIFIVIGLAELAHQFIKIGGVPLLSPQGNSLRFKQGGPTIVLTDLLTVAAIAAFVQPRNLLARESRFELMIGIVALGGFALQAGRGSIILPVVVATAARWLYWGRPRGSILAAAGLLAFVAVVFGFYLRTRQNPYNPFEAELYGEILPTTPFFLQPLVPIYLAITTNFVALQGVVGQFPTGSPFGGGVFDALGVNAIITSARNLSEVSAVLTPPWVTSTIAGPLWADGGFAVLVPGVAITGFLSSGAFVMATSTRSLRWSMAAGYLLYLVLFGLYTNLWTQEVDWILVLPLLLMVGAVVENPEAPPGLTGRIWAKIKRMTRRPRAQPAVKPPGDRWPNSRERKLAGRLVLTGVGALAVLVVSGLATQPLLPEPFPLVASMRLPASVAGATAVMTNSNPSQDNEELQWIKPQGRSIDLYSYMPGTPLSEVSRLTHMAKPLNLRHTTFDIDYWPPWRALALFSFQQHARWLSIRISPTWRSDGRPVSFQAPIVAPPPGTTRDLMIATWGGIKPDLFILTRGNPESRPLMQILSGESGFQRQLFTDRLGFRGLSPEKWSVDVGQIADIPPHTGLRVVRGIVPDLLLVRHDPEKKRSDIQVLLGESGFQWDAFQRDLDNSGSVPAGTEFLIGSHQGATAVYEIQKHSKNGPYLRIFALSTPPPFK